MEEILHQLIGSLSHYLKYRIYTSQMVQDFFHQQYHSIILILVWDFDTVLDWELGNLFFLFFLMFPKIGGNTPRMDGENNGSKPYEQMDDLG